LKTVFVLVQLKLATKRYILHANNRFSTGNNSIYAYVNVDSVDVVSAWMCVSCQ